MKFWLKALAIGAAIEAMALVLWFIPGASLLSICLLWPGVLLAYGAISHYNVGATDILLLFLGPLLFWGGVAALVMAVGGAWRRSSARRQTTDVVADSVTEPQCQPEEQP